MQDKPEPGRVAPVAPPERDPGLSIRPGRNGSGLIIDRALSHHRAGRLQEAQAQYRQILDREPNNPDVLHLLGMIHFQERRYADARESIARAIAIAPTAAEFQAGLGQALFAEGKIAEAIASYRHALTLRPDMPDVHYNLGSALLVAREYAEAVASLRRAIAAKPEFADAYNNLGSAFRGLNRLDEAANCYQRALALQPADAKACVNLGQVLKSLGQIDAALACFDRALTIQPGLVEARSGKVYTLHFHPGCKSEHLLWENLLWNQWHAKPLRTIRRRHLNEGSLDRKLRIGYVSPDFRDHVAGLYLLPLLREHDKEKFEIYCYSNTNRRDPITDRFRSYCTGWRDIALIDDEKVERMIRADRIDILVDATMHMGGNRLLLFARKPAPIQATICAYPSTTGVETIDYRFTDPHLDPPEAGDAYYSERSIRLPGTFWCYEPLDEEPAAGRLPAGDSGPITFGCLNNFCKVNDAVLTLWSRVLQALPSPRILLMTPAGSSRSRVVEKLGRDGIAAERIEFVDLQPRPTYLKTYHRIDIALDTFPYNGHTTSLDAFWMGVPVITLVGQTAVGRAGFSQLSNLGMTELAARDADQFVAIAIRLANDRERLASLRATLRQRMKASPLMDAASFARGFEAGFRQMWEGWCEADHSTNGFLQEAFPKF